MPADESIHTVADGSGEPPPDTAFVVEVVAGPDAGKRVVLDASCVQVHVGSGPFCELQVSDRAVSRRHASLVWGRSHVRITDEGSTNGTFVDRVRILEAQLGGGEIVRLGSTMLRVSTEALGPVVPSEATSFGRLVGASPAMRRLYPLCERLAQSDVPVVIEGETGTGKEVLAESLHEMGPRAKGPFIVFDCTAVPTNLAESELFGHERGAFTGATSTRRGVFEQAHGGTLFVDEIGDLDPTLQPKLLRALERSEVRRVGGDRWIKVDVRVVSATRRNLDKEVELGRFRDDLFHRLAVARIELPALRDRREDIALLTRHIWQKLGAAGAPSEAWIARLRDERWPGNVRELRNVVARMIALGDLEPSSSAAPSTGEVTMESLLAAGLPFIEARERLVEEFERRFVERLLAEHGGDSASAANASGIGRRYFQKLRKRHRG